jgi:hypothetical protein
MTNFQLQRAQSMIKMGNYDDAYVILKKIDHPTARKWLEQIDAIQRERQQQENKKPEVIEQLPSETFKPAPVMKPARSSSSKLTDFAEISKISTNRYFAARFIAGLYIFSGIAVGAIGIVFGLLLGDLSTPFVGLLSGLGLFAVGQIIQMILEFVENSRTQIRILQRIADNLENNRT